MIFDNENGEQRVDQSAIELTKEDDWVLLKVKN